MEHVGHATDHIGARLDLRDAVVDIFQDFRSAVFYVLSNLEEAGETALR
jgi:hypothetical protein